LGVEPENIIPGNGSAELIYMLANYFRPQKALMGAPMFCEYELAVRAAGGEVIYFDLKKEQNFSFPVKEIVAKLADVQMLFLGNPNNPTGNLIPRQELVEIVEVARSLGVVVVVDEAFMDFVESRSDFSLIQEACREDRLIVLGSLTKFFSIAGLRLGYAGANRRLVEKLDLSKCPWNVNCFAQVVGIAALRDTSFILENQEAIEENREHFFEALSGIDFLKPYPSEANFILVEIEHSTYNSVWLKEELLKQGFLIRDASSFKGLNDCFFRLAVRSRQDNEKLVEALRKILI
jgi:threonine-phosphate decarboxylase